ncbi:MAG: VIT1/CCC1 transporter family protein [Alphaproteobacteria bacterium]|nr:VIT1/CCC1 transporter family protein [Alphaproteobacteria bacterium]MCL2890255.1 VIT1/CCC1 transporter family protein [Alphaproteobacteria bacterium]
MAKNKNILQYTGAMVLGLHDALVSQTGIIVGLAFALADERLIILSSVIAAVAASLSMGASNYLAQKSDANPRAIIAGVYTGIAYLVTAALLTIPFAIISNRFFALGITFVISVLIIFGFNYWMARAHGRPFIGRFLEMLGICVGVSVAAFAIGQLAKYFLGVSI